MPNKNQAQPISLGTIYEKNINFLIGSGASDGIAPTLALEIRQADGQTPHTFETLGKCFEEYGRHDLMSLLLMHYYVECISPILTFDYGASDRAQREVIEQYKKFLSTIQVLLSKKRNHKQCNIFTTNYDDCFVQAIEQLYREGKFDTNLNDGAKGFSKKYLSVRNFNTVQYETSPFRQHKTEIAQINLVHLHGSVFWRKENELTISVDYRNRTDEINLESIYEESLLNLKSLIMNKNTRREEFSKLQVSSEVIDPFISQYHKLPIVNPTKWKFHETVFEEHYYQMLRYMSYELEKENSVLIVFGFSFSDEHILNIIKRSLANPFLKVFICCFTKQEEVAIRSKFPESNSIHYISLPSASLDFEAFNKYIFNEKPKE